ncbi:MAG TPA: helix-hairpin-helix domain-containing protein [Geobacteraceae bacterium]|nr:helix-hairpin-helix domain-containing protein [Geobacteraceae bacterium]
MKQQMKELQKLKGVGTVLAQRLVAAGLDTFAKIAAAGEEGLKKIQGLNPRMIQPILTQAGEMIGEAQKSKAEKVAELKQKTDALKVQVQEIALSIRDRFKEEVVGKAGRKLEKEIVKVISSLEKVEGQLESKVKKAGKGLVKAEKRLADLADAKLKGIGKGLKKARKSLKRVYS